MAITGAMLRLPASTAHRAAEHRPLDPEVKVKPVQVAARDQGQQVIAAEAHVVQTEHGPHSRAPQIVLVHHDRKGELHALMRDGAIDGLSIGFRHEKARTEPRTGLRRLERIDLWEVSVVGIPKAPQARLRVVRAN